MAIPLIDRKYIFILYSSILQLGLSLYHDVNELLIKVENDFKTLSVKFDYAGFILLP